MNYGNKLKKLISELDLENKDFVNESFNIAQFQNNLNDANEPIPSRVLSITKTLIHNSITKNKVIDLNFDRTFNNNDECTKLRILNIVELDINNWLNMPETIDETKLDNHYEYICDNIIGYYNCHILFRIAKVYELVGNIDKEFEAYTISFNTFFEYPNVEYFHNLMDHTARFGKVAVYLKDYNSILNIHQNLLDYADNLEIIIDPKIFYNIALYYYKIREHDKSIIYLDLFLLKKARMTKQEIANCMLLKGLVHNSLGLYEVAINAYLESLKELTNTDLYYSKALCHGNIIRCIYENNLVAHKEHLSNSIECLHNIIVIKKKQHIKLSVNYWNIIGNGYQYLANYDDASIAFDKAFLNFTEDFKYSHTVALLHDSLDSYKALRSFSTISNNISKIDTNKMSEDTLKSYQDFIGKLSKIL